MAKWLRTSVYVMKPEVAPKNWLWSQFSRPTIALNTESTYNWESDQWLMPINFTVQQLLRIGPQIIQVGGGVRYWAESPAAGLVTGVPEYS